MNKLFTPLLFTLIAANLAAQAYTLTVDNQTYTDLEGGTTLTDEADWDDTEIAVPLGFAFTLFGTPIDTLYSQDFGVANLSDIRYDTLNEYETSRHLLLVDNYGELANRKSAGGNQTSTITYHPTGTAPNRIGIIQWRNAGFYEDIFRDDVSDYFTNVQLWLYERDGTFEVRYGATSPEIISNDSMSFGAGVLLVEDYVYVDNGNDEVVSLSDLYVLLGDPADPTLERLSVSELDEDLEPELDSYPVEGTVYRFTASGTSGIFQPRATAGTFEVFPNPVTDRFSVNLPESLAGRVSRLELFDATGHRLRDLAALPASVDMADVPAGLYHVRLTTDTGSWLMGRVVKR